MKNIVQFLMGREVVGVHLDPNGNIKGIALGDDANGFGNPYVEVHNNHMVVTDHG